MSPDGVGTAFATVIGAIVGALAAYLPMHIIAAKNSKAQSRRYLRALKFEIIANLDTLEGILSNPQNVQGTQKFQFVYYNKPEKYAPIFLAYANAAADSESSLVEEVFEFYAKFLNLGLESINPAVPDVFFPVKADLEESRRRGRKALEKVNERIQKLA